jgi:hypothetical protein
MKKRKMNEGNIDADNEETLEPDRRGAEDGGWGRIRSNNGSTRAMKTKGSWAFARRTLSCENPTDPPTIKVTSLTVLAAKQVATIISDKDMRQLAPIHAELIRKTGIKRKREKEEGGLHQPKSKRKRMSPPKSN